jgi:hypothetical protein
MAARSASVAAWLELAKYKAAKLRHHRWNASVERRWASSSGTFRWLARAP